MSKITTNICLDIPSTYSQAINFLNQKNVVVMGGIVPGQTTDAVASIMAEYINSDLFLIATSVNGVYTSDPKINNEAKKYDHISIKKILEMAMSQDLNAGSKSPIDPIACKIIERSKINTIIYDGKDLLSLKNIISNKDYILSTKKCCGTIIDF